MAQSAGDLVAYLFREAGAERHRALGPAREVDSASSGRLDAFLIELHVSGWPILVLGLSADGAVNRFGSGKLSSIGNEHEHAVIAQTDGRFFHHAEELFQPSWLGQPRVQILPEQRGASCVLRLTFMCWGHPFYVLEWHYGSHSEGPPAVIRQFFIRAVEVTQSWYDAQNRGIDRLDKPWWKFW